MAKEQFKKSLITFINSEVGRRFKEILDQQMRDVEMSEIKTASYDSEVNWAYKQAHLNGYRQHIHQLYDLFTTEIK